MTASDFGSRLRATRERMGMSQTDLTAAGLSKSYISLLESGHRQPSRKMAEALAVSLGVDSDYLLLGIDRSTRQERELRLRFAQLALHNGNAREARDTLESMQREMAPDDPSRFTVAHSLANAHERTGDLRSAVEILEQLRERAEVDPARWPWLQVVIDLARCYREAGDLHRAVDVAERTIERAQTLGLADAEAFPRLVVTLAGVSRERGDHTHASQLLSRLLTQLGQTGSRRDRGSALWNAALVAGDRGEYADGILLAERAISLFAEEDDDRAYGVLRTVLAWMLIEAGRDPDVALDLLLQAHARLTSAGLRTDLAYTETELSRACTALNQLPDAIRWAQHSLERLEQGSLENARARLALARALLASGERGAAILEMQQGAHTLDKLAASRQAAGSWRELAELFIAIDDHPAANQAYRNVARLLGLPELPHAVLGDATVAHPVGAPLGSAAIT